MRFVLVFLLNFSFVCGFFCFFLAVSAANYLDLTCICEYIPVIGYALSKMRIRDLV